MTVFEIRGEADKSKDKVQFFLEDIGNRIDVSCHSVLYDTNYTVVSVSKKTGLLHRSKYLPKDIGIPVDSSGRIKEDNE